MRSATSSATDQSCFRTVVLLRGINVGGRHLVPMPALRECFAGLGCREITTYIQSGNLVCLAPCKLTDAGISTALLGKLGFAIPVALRREQEFNAIVSGNPLIAETPGSEEDVGSLHLVLLEQPLSIAALAGLIAKRAGEERLVPCGRELFLKLPHGVGRSKLALACTGPSMPGSPTMRNWRTILQLHRILRGGHLVPSDLL